MTARHEVVQLAAPGVGAVRDVSLADLSDVQRAAALVEIAGAAAVLARTIYKYRHIDPVSLDGLVSRRVDVGAVLGRTPLRMVDLDATPPAPYRPGDRVRFRAIRASDWDRHAGTALEACDG